MYNRICHFLSMTILYTSLAIYGLYLLTILGITLSWVAESLL